MLPFHERLSVLIKTLNVSTSEFGRMCDINRVSLNNFLHNKTRPTLETLEKICAADPRISGDYLLKGTGEPLVSEVSEASIEAEYRTMLMIMDLQTSVTRVLGEYTKKLNKYRSNDDAFARVG